MSSTFPKLRRAIPGPSNSRTAVAVSFIGPGVAVRRNLCATTATSNMLPLTAGWHDLPPVAGRTRPGQGQHRAHNSLRENHVFNSPQTLLGSETCSARRLPSFVLRGPTKCTELLFEFEPACPKTSSGDLFRPAHIDLRARRGQFCVPNSSQTPWNHKWTRTCISSRGGSHGARRDGVKQ